MKKYIIACLISLYSCSIAADEGMWLPQLIKLMNEKDMQKCGLKLTADELYNINQSSLKDAIVSLGGFCTGEMISDQGLMLTNHHCALRAIQEHSSVKNDYLKDGFWAMSKKDELPNKGLTATFLINIVDVTEEIVKELNNKMSEEERNKKIKELAVEIEKKYIKDSHYTAKIKSFFGGNNFFVMVYETFKDVRLVGAPPSSIGKFGGDTDNWMWPRHTGDFTLFRVYCGPDGKPADYSLENVPYEPKHHLPVQLDGVENGDYTMIFGFPGSTDRYLTSFGVKHALEYKNPTIVKIRDEKLSIMKKGMDSDPKIKIQYASKYASTSNYWKYFIGQSKGLKRMKVYNKKVKLENQFRTWVDSTENRKSKYGDVLENIKNAYLENSKISANRLFLNEAIFSGAEILYFSYKIHRSISQLPDKKDLEKRSVAIKKIKLEAEKFYKNYNSIIDEELLSAMLEMYYYNVPSNQHAPIFKNIENQLLGFKKLDFDYYAENVFKNSIFSSQEKFMFFLKNPSVNTIELDPAYKTIMSIYNKYVLDISVKRKNIRQTLLKENRLFIAGIQKMLPKEKFYPNANSTMRVTYGNVGDYRPGNAIHYDYYTTIEGIMEKEDSTNEEFIVPKKLKQLYENKDYSNYQDENGQLRINFISSNDITGGNSGSPVLNAWGEIVGTVFDGNWEAMSGDIAFENKIQRAISVDIRYVLFVIDKFAGANHLINEMTIAPSRNISINSFEGDKQKESDNQNENDVQLSFEKTKSFYGEPVPVLIGDDFKTVFKKAKTEFGANKNIKFWWNNNIYTTEQK